MAMQPGQTIDASIPTWLKDTERHPVYGVPLVYFKSSDGTPRTIMIFCGIVNETGQVACSRLTNTGPGDYIFTFDLERFCPVPGYKPAVIPAQ